MSMGKNNNFYINLILKNKSNNFCVDCGRENPTHVSINNGITLCEDCADVHLLLGISISYIRLLYGKWDNYLYKFFQFGGNENFLNSLKLFQIDRSKYDISTVYKTKVVFCYRYYLKNKVNGKDKDILIDENEKFKYDLYHEFLDYKVDNDGVIVKTIGNVSRKIIGGIDKGIKKMKWKVNVTKMNVIHSVKGIFSLVNNKKKNKGTQKENGDK